MHPRERGREISTSPSSCAPLRTSSSSACAGGAAALPATGDGRVRHASPAHARTPTASSPLTPERPARALSLSPSAGANAHHAAVTPGGTDDDDNHHAERPDRVASTQSGTERRHAQSAILASHRVNEETPEARARTAVQHAPIVPLALEGGACEGLPQISPQTARYPSFCGGRALRSNASRLRTQRDLFGEKERGGSPESLRTTSMCTSMCTAPLLQ